MWRWLLAAACWCTAAHLSLAQTVETVQPAGNNKPSATTAPGEAALTKTPAADELAVVPALEPDEGLKSFEIIPGFHLEFAAHEPAVVDPVAAAFDEDGRLYVAEMRDYPFRPKRGETPLGTIRLLEDRDGDGFFETSHVFADGLLWPTGVMPWQGGVFVTAAPSIWYFKDTDGDGRADEKKNVFSGFGMQNEQGSVNNLVWGLDNRIYGTSSKNGGQVRPGDAQREKALDIHGRDFCFDPRAPLLESISGNSQFGIAMNDWGDRFLCDQANPCSHVVLPERYLKRNPKMRVRDAVNDLAPGAVPSFRLSPIESWRAIRSTRRLESGERSAQSTGLSHDVLDGVAGPAIYRGQAFPAEYRGQLFVGDAQSNLVHRRLIKPAGVTFTSERADPGTEFIRSRDNWFRPVNVINAPDGTLYLLDMSREVIESVHVPLDVFAKIDYTRGRDRGRIYRIAPDGFRTPAKPALSGASTTELVGLLEHRGGWWRDTAQRLLYERQDQSAVAPLKELLGKTSMPEAKVHALYALDGLSSLREAELLPALVDEHAHVREHAVRLIEPLLATSPALVEQVLELSEDSDVRVRYQVAFTLGNIRGASEIEARVTAALVAILSHDGADPWLRTAVFSSCSDRADRVLGGLIDNAVATPDTAAVRSSLGPLAELAGRTATPEQIALAINRLAAAEPAAPVGVRDAVLLGIATGRRDAGGKLADLVPFLSAPAAAMREQAVNEAIATAADQVRSVGERSHAVQMLVCASFEHVEAPLANILSASTPESLKQAVLRTLGTFDAPAIARLTIAPWQTLSPNVRESALGVLLSRPAWTLALLDAVTAGKIPANQISGTQRSTLLHHGTASIAERAQAIWNATNSPRADVIAAYRPALETAADAAQGEKVYERECSACHQLGNRGFAVGPNLALARHRTAEELLIHILDPNREVQPAYIQYVVTDVNGGTFAGLVAADTSTGITLRQDRGVERTILKSDIDELASTDRSLMAEGFEKTIKPQEMADLLAFLMQIRYQIGTQPGHTEPSADVPRFVKQWGQRGSKEGEFDFPIGIAINRADEVFVTDFYNARVQRFSADGAFLGAFQVAPFPGGLAIDQDGNLFVAHSGIPPSKFDKPRERDKIAVYDAGGKLLREWGQFGQGDGEFDSPGGIAISHDGRVYVADQCNRRIQVFDRTGKFLTKWGKQGFAAGEFGGNPHAKAFFAGPTFLACDKDGNVVSTEAILCRIQKFSPVGELLHVWSATETGPGKFGDYFSAFEKKNMRGPTGICFDAQGELWISAIGGRIQRFTAKGEYLSGFGAEGTEAGQFYAPHGIAIDSRGSLYIVDAFNHRIQKFEVGQ